MNLAIQREMGDVGGISDSPPLSQQLVGAPGYNDTDHMDVFTVHPTTSTPGVQEELPFLPWDNPENLISLPVRETVRFIVHGVLNCIFTLVGVPTNVVSCLVFYKQGLRDRMNLCLFVLALVDAVMLMALVSTTAQAYVRFWDELLAEELYVKCLVNFSFVLYAARASSACITMVIAVERCVCIVLPLRVHSVMKTRSMGALLAAIITLFLSTYSIINFRHRVVEVRDPNIGRTRYTIAITDFFLQHPMVYNIVFELSLSIVVPLVTFSVVGVATAVTVIKLRSALAWRARTTSSGRADHPRHQHQAALTKMLVILSCVFMTCALPLTSLRMAALFVPEFSVSGRYFNLFITCIVVANNLLNINSTINFFVYFSRSSRFRQDLYNICSLRNKMLGIKSNGSADKPEPKRQIALNITAHSSKEASID